MDRLAGRPIPHRYRFDEPGAIGGDTPCQGFQGPAEACRIGAHGVPEGAHGQVRCRISGGAVQEGKAAELVGDGPEGIGVGLAEGVLQLGQPDPCVGSGRILGHQHSFQYLLLRYRDVLERSLQAATRRCPCRQRREIGYRGKAQVRARSEERAQLGVGAGSQLVGQGTDCGHCLKVTGGRKGQLRRLARTPTNTTVAMSRNPSGRQA